MTTNHSETTGNAILFVKVLLGLTLFAVLVPFGSIGAAEPAGNPLPIPPILEPEIRSDGSHLFRLSAAAGTKEFHPGVQTPTLGYNGSYLGPTIRASRGRKITIRVENRLSESSTAHWHGAHLPADADGGPHQEIGAGKTWDASFTVNQPAATLWYHPHFMGSTARQVYEGLAGMFIIDDEFSGNLGLPDDYGNDDIPLILQERRFDSSGRFGYNPRMPDLMHGYFGNTMLVNGAVEPYKNVRIRGCSSSITQRKQLHDSPHLVRRR
ncbi:multicopper oxidase domain-containing protein [Roseovarius pacificus]|uniref:multicopper oxidase domain-containing protein n=1 Tax=Roseovarius pacificus TaxID=337701 RepID=UPI002A18D30A|nr:multicopper oxidase domain-containing protein [Roseovarius pacificus]